MDGSHLGLGARRCSESMAEGAEDRFVADKVVGNRVGIINGWLPFPAHMPGLRIDDHGVARA
jgi:hypothetical protein